MIREILAFLDVLLESGNTDVQEGLKEILKCKEHPMFATFERVLKEDAIAYSERCVHVMVEQNCWPNFKVWEFGAGQFCAYCKASCFFDTAKRWQML